MKAQTRIEKRVLQWAKRYNPENTKQALEDLTQHGCESGIVGELIYYRDTVKWFKYYRKDINILLVDTLEGFRGKDGLAYVFGNKWDITDPLAQDTHNQNLLAWFSFEESANNLLAQLEDSE